MEALFVLRVVVGALFAGHGLQKLAGWFGGHGPKATGSYFESIGIVPGVPLAIVAGAAELVGGILLGVGLFVPLACALLVAVMATAIATVHWRNGVWNADGGIELPLVLATAAFTVAAVGPGSLALDDAFGIAWYGLDWAAAAVAVGTLAAAAAVAFGRITHGRSHRGAQPHGA